MRLLHNTELSQGPLGIIALFIVLIDGFASLVLGFATDIGESNRSILVWFLVSFPVIVFFVFAWLVSCHHAKLYPPSAYTDGELAKLVYGNSGFDKQKLQTHSQQVSVSSSHLKTSATGNIYWLGHDLMWTADTLLRNGPKENVLTGLAQARHHLEHVGLGETFFEHEINNLQELIKQSEELSPSFRDACASQLGVIIDRVGITAEDATQPSFQEPPYWKRVRSQKLG